MTDVTNGKIDPAHYGPVGDAARNIASYCEGNARVHVYTAAFTALATHVAQIEALRVERDALRVALEATRDHCPRCDGEGEYPFGPSRNRNIVPCEFCEIARAALGEPTDGR